MRKGVDGFENVTAIHTSNMEKAPFVLGIDDGVYAATALKAWNGSAYQNRDIAEMIVEQSSPMEGTKEKPLTIKQVASNELRIKRLSIIEHEEQLGFEVEDSTLSQLYDVLNLLDVETVEHLAVYNVTMLYRAHLRHPGDESVHPLTIIGMILMQAEDKAELNRQYLAAESLPEVPIVTDI